MGFPAALETVSFYDTLEAAPLALATDVDLVPDLYQLGKLDFLPNRIGLRIADPEFLDMIKSAFAGSLAMTPLRFIHPGAVYRLFHGSDYRFQFRVVLVGLICTVTGIACPISE